MPAWWKKVPWRVIGEALFAWWQSSQEKKAAEAAKKKES
jgi:hypothetical protein